MMHTIEIKKHNILLVDDDHFICRVVGDLIGSLGYHYCIVNNGKDAIKELESNQYTVLISDINMPQMNGIELLKEINKRNIDTAVIMLTGISELDTATKCLIEGAYDYLTKPPTQERLSIAIERSIERYETLCKEKLHLKHLEQDVKQQTKQLQDTMNLFNMSQLLLNNAQEEVIYRLAIASEFRDEETWCHLLRISNSCYYIAKLLGKNEEQCHMLRVASLLHDVGKIGIPDSILTKPGKLTNEEYEIIKTHTIIGKKILFGSEYPLLKMACEIAYYHHEHYGGGGYPCGIMKEHIPEEARILSVLDVYDALTSKRPYKAIWTKEAALTYISSGSGKQFDPVIVEIFIDNYDKIINNNQYDDFIYNDNKYFKAV